jgi:hypothetical protein
LVACGGGAASQLDLAVARVFSCLQAPLPLARRHTPCWYVNIQSCLQVSAWCLSVYIFLRAAECANPSSLAAVYNTATEAPEPDQSPRAALHAHTASYATAVTRNTAPPPPSTYAAAASTSSSGGSRRSGSAADMVLAAIQTTRQRAHAKMAGRARQVGACRTIEHHSSCRLFGPSVGYTLCER